MSDPDSAPDIPDILLRLRELQVHLWLDGEHLRYRAPQGVMTAELQAELVKHKARIIAHLQQANPLSAPSIVPLPRPEKIPLSFAQQRLWLFDQLASKSAAYNMFSAIHLSGLIDVTALAHAFQKIVNRHESLRTTFQSADGQPYQLIAAELPVILPIIDVSNLSQDEIEELIRTEARRPFDLAQAPLVRCSLLRIAPDQHILMVSMHHIITDGWSMGIFFREIIQISQAHAAGQPGDILSPLTLQYPDFSIWQRNWLQGELLEKQLGYWKQQLENSPLTLELPMDHPRPAIQTYHGARLHTTFPKPFSDSLLAFSRQENVTSFMLLLTAFYILLFRYSGQHDILVGSPVANRNRSELSGIIGFFANTIILRANLSGNPSFRQCLHQVQETCLSAYDHQDIQFEKLLDELHIPRDLSRNPLFQVMFIVQNSLETDNNIGGVHVQPMNIEPDTSQFDLRMSLQETPEGLNCFIEYSTDLFDETTIALLIEGYQHILVDAMHSPEQPVRGLSLPPALTAKTPVNPTVQVPTKTVRKHNKPAFTAPRTPIETTLTKIWAQTLHIEQVGIHDNFFELGGNSLYATQVIARARSVYQVDIPFQVLFRMQTIAELAEFIEGAQMSQRLQASAADKEADRDRGEL